LAERAKALEILSPKGLKVKALSFFKKTGLCKGFVFQLQKGLKYSRCLLTCCFLCSLIKICQYAPCPLFGSSLTCLQCVNELELHQNGVVNKKCSILTIIGRVEATLSSAQLQPRSGTCLSRSSALRECPAVAFVKKHLKVNVKTKGKLMNSSVEQQQQAGYEYPPVQQLKVLDWCVQHFEDKQKVKAYSMPQWGNVVTLANQSWHSSDERLRWNHHQQSLGDNCHTSHEACRCITGFRSGCVSPTPEARYWDDEDGWSSSGPEVSARDYERESEVPGQGLDKQSDMSERMYELSECSDKSSVISEPVKGNGQLRHDTGTGNTMIICSL
jgi:hypothetical protein